MSDNIFIKFKRILKEFGLVYFNRYYGFYPAECVENNDPDKLHRLRVKCKAVWGNHVPEKWIPPKSLNAAKKSGTVNVPMVGQKLWLEFAEGDPSHPFYLPAHYSKGNLPEPALIDYPNTAGIYNEDGFYAQYNKKTQEGVIYHPEKIVWLVDKERMLLNYKEKYFIIMKEQGIEISDDQGNSLFKSLDELIKEIKLIQVPTPLGPSGTPINALKFDAILNKIKQFLV